MMKYSTSSSSLMLRVLSLHLTVAVLLSPGTMVQLHWLFGGPGENSNIFLVSASDLTEGMTLAPKEPGEVPHGSPCTPLGELIASRFNRGKRPKH